MSSSKNLSGYKDKQSHIPGLKIRPALKTIKNVYPDTKYMVELDTKEFSSICPKTGLPDFAHLFIRYRPAGQLVEEKSLKLYLNGYRGVGIFQEHAVNKIFEDFLSLVKPEWLQVKADWNRRGGIGVTVMRETGEEA